VNLKAFFVAALASALDLGIAVPDDVLRHMTPDVLAAHLPRPLWARLITACLGAGRVDAQLVIETLGVPNLCEHVPAQIVWNCIQMIAARSLDGVVMAAPSTRTSPILASSASRPVPLAMTPPPPPSEPRPSESKPSVALGPSIPAPNGPDTETEGFRSRVAPSQRFRPSGTSMGRLPTNPGTQRRPQAQATPPDPPPAPPVIAAGSERSGRVRRGQTEADFDLETFVGGKDDWKSSLAVEDDQLVDWSASDETVAGDDLDRKR
jgi:hypothetical protein